MPATDGSLRVEGVTVRFGGVSALSDVSFRADAGTTVSLVGPNGAGKTTLLNAISGLVRPTDGRVFFGDVDVVAKSPHSRARMGIGRTFQGDVALQGLTVSEAVLLSWDAGRKLRRKDHYEAVRWALDYLSLGAFQHRQVNSLAFGYRKLVDVARALAGKPGLLLYDEPASGLNGSERETLIDTMHRIRSELGLTQVIIEHDMNLVRQVSDWVTVLNFGTVLANGLPDDVLKNPEVVSAYFGDGGEDGATGRSIRSNVKDAT